MGEAQLLHRLHNVVSFEIWKCVGYVERRGKVVCIEKN